MDNNFSFINFNETDDVMGNYVDSFEEFLNRKKRDEEAFKKGALDRHNRWLDSVSKLYDQIRGILSGFEEKGLLSFEELEIEKEEEYIGHYKIKQLDIIFGSSKINLVPIGTYVVGYDGRVDMRGINGSIMILLKDSQWKFASKISELKLIEISQENLLETITRLSE